jgi:hypothetical protein
MGDEFLISGWPTDSGIYKTGLLKYLLYLVPKRGSEALSCAFSSGP